jgi:16S rRNA (guanine966-N2)-methyltransferase
MAMRITGGELRGRILKVPRAGLRPTQDRVRESLFSMVAPRLGGARFLDLYAGSGAVGIEAWSRGAGHVCWVEFHPTALRCLEENVRVLCRGEGRLVRGDVLKVLRRGFANPGFDLVYADPPYAKDVKAPEAVETWRRLLDALEVGEVVVPGGWLAMEQRDGEAAVERAGWTLIRDRRYGGSRLRILERTSEGAST